jgi:cytochrome c553
VYGALQAFRDGTRFSGIMGEVAARLDDAAMRAIADYYEALPARVADASGDSPAIARGSAIAAGGVPQRDIPACAECHGPAEQPKNPAYPRLASQHARYLASQLRLLKERRRGGSPHVTLMQGFVDRLTDEDIHDVIQYYAALQ